MLLSYHYPFIVGVITALTITFTLKVWVWQMHVHMFASYTKVISSRVIQPMLMQLLIVILLNC